MISLFTLIVLMNKISLCIIVHTFFEKRQEASCLKNNIDVERLFAEGIYQRDGVFNAGFD
jgi:hypothetical protein